MLEALRNLLGNKVSTVPAVLETHGRDENYAEVRRPLAVVFAETVDDVLATLNWARRQRVPLIAYGAGTSLEGNVVPIGEAVSLDLSRMNRVVRISPEDFMAVVEPGLTRVALNTALRDRGLFFPVDPGADASLGGMAATNASGTTTVRYGGMRANVAALQVALASGELVEFGRPVRKSSSGYDLKDLIIGSAGTLGIITRLSLHLHPLPEHVHTLRVSFETLSAAADAAYLIMASGLPVARLELLDRLSMHAINQHLHRQYLEQPVLFLEFHSSSVEAMAAESDIVRNVMREAGATDLATARTHEERLAQWEARHRLYDVIRGLFPGRSYTITDTAVPLSRVADLVTATERLLAEYALEGSILGHVGDGNFHTLVATRPEDTERAARFAQQLVAQALAMDGTASGEHGIGLTKRRHMEAEHAGALAWMRQIKALFDPLGILNPGKIV